STSFSAHFGVRKRSCRFGIGQLPKHRAGNTKAAASLPHSMGKLARAPARDHHSLMRFCLIAVTLFLFADARGAEDLQIASRLVVAPGNLTITPDGRQIVSLHQFFSPKNRVVELAKDGSFKPFPNA